MAIVKRKPSESFKESTYRHSPRRMSPEQLRDFAADNAIPLQPVDVARLARAIGLRVISEAMDDDLSGYLERRGSGWVIGVNSLHHPKRQRFTIAHELGHYFLHSVEKDRFSDEILLRRNERRNEMELEADKFAGELLMPDDEFRRKIEDGVRSVSDLSEYFGTSMLAVKYKAEILGYQVRG